MKYFNCIFLVECVHNVDMNTTVYYLRTNDGRVMEVSDEANFTAVIQDFVGKSVNVSK